MLSWPSGKLMYAGVTCLSFDQVSLTIVLNLKDGKKTIGMMDVE